jgi:very-short-patch-repair endonuclease
VRRDPVAIARARELRANETAAEAKLWSALRAKQLGGFKFRRQHPIGQYIADFVCLPARLVIEVDGATHGEDREADDQARTAYMERCGFRVIRVWNGDILEAVDDVAAHIAYELGLIDHPRVQTFPKPTPSP